MEPIERGHDLAGRPVRLEDGVAARPEAAGADEARMRHARYVRVVEREVEEERLRLVRLDELHRARSEDVGLLQVPAIWVRKIRKRQA